MAVIILNPYRALPKRAMNLEVAMSYGFKLNCYWSRNVTLAYADVVWKKAMLKCVTIVLLHSYKCVQKTLGVIWNFHIQFKWYRICIFILYYKIQLVFYIGNSLNNSINLQWQYKEQNTNCLWKLVKIFSAQNLWKMCTS